MDLGGKEDGRQVDGGKNLTESLCISSRVKGDDGAERSREKTRRNLEDR